MKDTYLKNLFLIVCVWNKNEFLLKAINQTIQSVTKVLARFYQ